MPYNKYDQTKLSEAISLFSNRLLQDEDDTQEPETMPPTDATDRTPSSDNVNGDGDANNSSISDAKDFGLLVFVVVVLILLFVAWRSFQKWKIRREQYQLQVQSARADSVLGDMQMVGNDEYDDDDPELL